MSILLVVIVLGSLIGAVVGLVMCALRSTRRRGLIVGGASCVVHILSLIALGSLNSESSAIASQTGQARQATSNVAETTLLARPPTKNEMISQFRIGGLSWKKHGFGTVMVASFTIHNDNSIAVKDVKVACSSSGPSGTIINRNARTFFEKIEQRSYLEISEFNMGFIRTESVETKCKVVDFTTA